MKTKLSLLLLAFTLIIHTNLFAESDHSVATSDTSNTSDTSDSIKQSMKTLYTEFRNLHPFMVSRENFLMTKNQNEISGILTRLKTTVDSLEKVHPLFKSHQNLDGILLTLYDTLADAERGFSEGRKGWALWRLRSVANACMTCHISYKKDLKFCDSSEPELNESDYSKGEFYLATRQFGRAKDAFMKAVLKEPLLPASDYQRIDALRKWLTVYTRVTNSPDEALNQLNEISRKVKFLAFELEEISAWVESLKNWQQENKPKILVPLVRQAENLLRRGLTHDDPIFATQVGTVELLRATSLLHATLEEQKALSSAERGHILYLLGFAYARLPQFFINELPEIYLEQAIRESPKSDAALRAIRLYTQLITQEYTGSGGTHIPEEILGKLSELHRIATEGRVTEGRPSKE